MSALIRYYPGDWGVDFLLVVTLAVALASSAGWLISRRLAGKAALRHLVLFSALICCLASPVLAWVSSTAGLTLFSVPILGGQEQRTKAPSVTQLETHRTEIRRRPWTDPPPVAPELPSPLTHTPIDQSADAAPAPLPNQGRATLTPSAPDVQHTAISAGTLVLFRGIATGAVLMWSAGALLMLMRLAGNCGRVVLLRRASRPSPNASHQALLHEIAARLGMRRDPLLLVSSRTVTPLAVGFGRPAVILPACLLGAISDNELRDVLTHELAHLKRGDQHTVLLQELAGALYWPIVSVHALNRELRRASEQLCDNIVLTAGRSAVSYGETLLHIALLLVTARSVKAAVGIVGGQGELERRVAGLIDPRRNTMTATGRKTSCLVMFMFIAFAAIASSTRFAASAATADGLQSDAAPPTAPTGTRTTLAAAPAQPGKTKPEPDSNRTIILHGKVLGPGDRPVAGARFYLDLDEWTSPVELGTSNADGSYRLAVPEKQLRRTVTSGFMLANCQAALIVTAPGLGSGWEELPDVKGGRYGEMKPEYSHDFHLAADFPIAGQVVDSGGKPIRGAVVGVDAIIELSDRHWWKMPRAIKAHNPGLLTRAEIDTNNWFTSLYPTAWRMISPATTDSEGRFRITGGGGNRAIRLRVDGPGIRSAWVSVLTRDDVADFTQAVRAKYPRARRPNGSFYPPKDPPEGDQGVLLFGPSPTIEVDPARTVAGIVRDAGTGEPIAGIRVGTGETDTHGRYRMFRAEDVPSFLMFVQPYTHDRYLTVMRRITNANGFGEIIADFDVPRGVVISGHVLEAGTNRPMVSGPRHGCHDTGPGPLVAGNVTYFPLSTNTGLRGQPTGLYFEGIPTGSSNYSIDAVIGPDGSFRMAVPPGPGVLLVRSSPGMPMFAEYQVWKESEGLHRLFPYPTLAARAKNDGAPQGDAHSFPGFTGPIPIAGYHAYRVINPPADAKVLDLTLTVPRGPSRLLRFVGPDGRPIRGGVSVRGLVGSMTIVLDGSEVEALAFAQGESRKITATSNDINYIINTSISGADPQPAMIQLGRAGSITGRIIDENGKPVKALLLPDQQTKAAPGVGFAHPVRSEADGRFRMPGLLPGLRYSAEIRGGGLDIERVGTAFANVLLYAGEVRDLGDIRIKGVR